MPDTHAHLDASAFDGDLKAVLQRASEAGIGPVLAVGSDLASSLRAVGIAQRFENVYAAVGVHPHEAARFAEERERVRALLDEEKVVAVGEIGLDYYRDLAPIATQREAFREQLEWARERGLPASVHNRSADRDVLSEIRDSGVTAVFHCFSGDWETCAAGLDLGCMVSFAGNVTFPKSADLRAVAGKLPVDRLLVESDAPVLAPQLRRGRRNEPAYVVMTAEVLAAERGLSLEDFGAAVRENAEKVFGWGAA